MLPPGLDGQLLSRPDFPANCSEFVARSPESTIYHSTPYIGFARRENGAADVLVVRSEGKPLFALPSHPDSRGRWISTGYSGALFAVSDRETELRKSVSALREFLDVNREGGMTVSIGRIRSCTLFDYKFVALGHNTIRGAAGAAILNAELMHREGLL